MLFFGSAHGIIITRKYLFFVCVPVRGSVMDGEVDCGIYDMGTEEDFTRIAFFGYTKDYIFLENIFVI